MNLETATHEELVNSKLESLRAEASDILAICKRIEPILRKLPKDVLEGCSIVCGALLIYGTSREQAESIMHALSAGRWSKSLNETRDRPRMNYTAQVDGVTVEIYGTSPPASCQIVEEAEYVPAHNRIKRTLVCGKAESLT